ncbi:MAG: hypothetical protein ACK6DC_21240 [Planctomycetota bacterium]|jgi:hypothetical protein
MRLRQRLSALEREAPKADDLSKRGRVELVRLVGRLDALFAPWRVSVRDIQSLRAMVAIRQKQQGYREGVFGLELRAVGASDWRAAQETRRELVAASLVEPITQSGQTQGLRITSLGDSLGRTLAGLKRAADCRWTLDRLRRLQAVKRPVSERRLWAEPCVGNPTTWAHLSEGILPLLAVGVVASLSSSVGEVYYVATDGDYSEPPIEAESEPTLSDAYFDAFNKERAALAESEPDTAELFIPIPAGME